MPWAQPKDVSIKIQNMDTLFRYVHSMDTFTKEYFCIHQIGKQAVAQLPTCKNSDLARQTLYELAVTERKIGKKVNIEVEQAA